MREALNHATMVKYIYQTPVKNCELLLPVYFLAPFYDSQTKSSNITGSVDKINSCTSYDACVQHRSSRYHYLYNANKFLN